MTGSDNSSRLEKIADFYDSFAEKQIKTGINLRHFTLFRELRKAGLKKDHKVLEVGCGIGTLTYLIHSYLRRGMIVATDISRESIQVAERTFAGSGRAKFVVTDMQEFSYPEKFDFIILPDVLEHIPVELHRNLFRVLRSLMHSQTVLFINIPHPRTIEFYRKHDQSFLQIIDQPIYSDALMNDVYHNGLELESYKSYCLFHKIPDAALILLRVREECQVMEPYSQFTIILNKLRNKLYYWFSLI
jgi:trans-aconitate 2-methyltransferase